MMKKVNPRGLPLIEEGCDNIYLPKDPKSLIFIPLTDFFAIMWKSFYIFICE